jgi:YidC/Oxa1 family membrane protein insertase
LPDIGGLYNALRDDLAAPLQALLVIMYHALAGVGIPSWGLTIVLFTVLVKLVFWPLTVQQIKASRAMQSLQPQLSELKKQHGKDKEKLMAAQMELYKQNRVNPMAGCLPMLIQFPIWIGLYQALYSLAGTADFAGGFLWIPSLALPEGFPYLLAILTAGSQFIVQRMMQVNTTDPQQKSMNQAMQFMPIMYLFISYRMPAGLVLYWVASNVFTLIQQSFYWGWRSAIPWRTAPAAALVSRSRREPVINPPAAIPAPIRPVDAVAAPSNGVTSGVSSGVAPRRTKKRRK